MWKWLWNLVTGKGQNLGPRDSVIVEDLEETIGRHGDIESNPGEGSEESNGDDEKSSIVLENFYIVNRALIET